MVQILDMPAAWFRAEKRPETRQRTRDASVKRCRIRSLIELPTRDQIPCKRTELKTKEYENCENNLKIMRNRKG